MRTTRSRTRTRKTELLSLLRLDHSTSAANMGNRARQHQQLKLFPLHPETANGSAEDTEGPHDYDENVNVSLLFSGDNTSATTLCGLLSDGEATIPVTAAAVACSEEGSIGSHGSEFDEGDHQHRSSLLVWAAMKSRARDKEEKWVSYNELVERKPTPDLEPEEVSSCVAAFNGADDGRLGSSSWQPKGEAGRLTRQLLLKLDYEEVLSSWCDKGSLFINDNDGHLHQLHHEAAQTVPEVSDEFLGPESAIDTGLSDRWGRASLWTVPDQKGVDINSTMEEKGGRFRRREASILRYKEKRQTRLFTKQIRYDVRRLNAEKRPRIKGRFVRRSCKDD